MGDINSKKKRYHKTVNEVSSLYQVKAALSGSIGKVVASHAAVARSIPADVALIYTMHEAIRGYCP